MVAETWGAIARPQALMWHAASVNPLPWSNEKSVSNTIDVPRSETMRLKPGHQRTLVSSLEAIPPLAAPQRPRAANPDMARGGFSPKSRI